MTQLQISVTISNISCNGDPFIPETNVSYPINCINVFAVDGTPDDISPGRFCYAEPRGFLRKYKLEQTLCL